MKFENTEVFNFEGALRGMRNPLESWDKSDSDFNGGLEYDQYGRSKHYEMKIGKNDMELAQKLIKAGSEHRKFLRQIFVSVDITAPIFWFKELDTYKVGTVSNSTSTMHKLASTPITIDCFEHGKLSTRINPMAEYINKHRLSEIEYLERLRVEYNKCINKDIKKEIWKALIEDLPESWLQKRTITMNYENLYSMIRERKNHKLSEWSKDFIEWAKTLPYAEEFLFIKNDNCIEGE